ncbi:hypothetical protein [Nostoc sp.]
MMFTTGVAATLPSLSDQAMSTMVTERLVSAASRREVRAIRRRSYN